MPQGPHQYDTLLRIRKRQEDLRAQALAVAKSEIMAAQEQRSQLAQEQMRALSRAGELAERAFDASDIRRYYQYGRHLARMGDAKDAEIRQLEQEAEARRTELMEATKRKRIVEKLQERRMRAHRDSLLRIEQRIMDEVASNYAVRGNVFNPNAPAQGKERETL